MKPGRAKSRRAMDHFCPRVGRAGFEPRRGRAISQASSPRNEATHWARQRATHGSDEEQELVHLVRAEIVALPRLIQSLRDKRLSKRS